MQNKYARLTHLKKYGFHSMSGEPNPISSFNQHFLIQAATYVLHFGIFWVLFTLIVMIAIEGRLYLQNLQLGITSLLATFYTGQTFYNFHLDLKQASQDSSFVLIPNIKKFVWQFVLYALLLSHQATLIFAQSVTSLYAFSTYSNAFFVFLLSMFRITYHFLLLKRHS